MCKNRLTKMQNIYRQLVANEIHMHNDGNTKRTKIHKCIMQRCEMRIFRPVFNAPHMFTRLKSANDILLCNYDNIHKSF